MHVDNQTLCSAGLVGVRLGLVCGCEGLGWAVQPLPWAQGLGYGLRQMVSGPVPTDGRVLSGADPLDGRASWGRGAVLTGDSGEGWQGSHVAPEGLCREAVLACVRQAHFWARPTWSANPSVHRNLDLWLACLYKHSAFGANSDSLIHGLIKNNYLLDDDACGL